MPCWSKPAIPAGWPGFQMPNGLMPTFTHGLAACVSAYNRFTKVLTASRRQSSRASLPPAVVYAAQVSSSGKGISTLAASSSGYG